MLERPKWCSPDVWDEVIAIYRKRDGLLVCDVPNCTEFAEHLFRTGDSIMAATLVPLCGVHYLAKLGKPAKYWHGRFYFDQFIATDRLRVSQRDYIMGVIDEHAEFFARPCDLINGKLFTYVQIVSAGKTIGAFVLPFAINAAVRRHNPRGPRVDRMLLVTKSQEIRDQMSRELQHEVVDLKIIAEPPRVKNITGHDALMSDEDYDIGVMCPNMLWPTTDVDEHTGEQLITHIEHYDQILARHPLIVFDEMHYAFRQIANLVKNARQSLVFGLTATPIEANGDLLDDIILMSVYGYGDAIRNDGSLKSL